MVGKGGWGLPPYMAFTEMCRWSGMGINLSVVNRVYNFVRLCPNLDKVLPALLIWFASWNLFVLQDRKAMPINGLKQDGVHFLLCAKQGNNIEGVVLHRVCVLGFCFVLNRVRGLQTLSSSPIVNYLSSTPSPPPPGLRYIFRAFTGLKRTVALPAGYPGI